MKENVEVLTSKYKSQLTSHW